MVLARQPRGTVLLLRQIAEAGHLPAGFLARTFQKLKRHNVVASHRGAVRGYALAKRPHEITLREIFEAIEGPNVFARDIFAPSRSGDRGPCRLDKEWDPIAERLRRVMEETTLARVASRRPDTADPGG